MQQTLRYGNVLIISPWNFLFSLAFMPLVGAIAAGNCVIIKPSEISPNTSGCIKKIIGSGFPHEYVKVREGDVEVTQELLQLEFDYIFFTGSPKTGRIIMSKAAEKPIPVTLELGGKNPCIIDENILLKFAAERLCWGKFFNAGQVCIAPDYLLVHKNVRDRFVICLQDAIQKFYGTDIQKSKDYPRIINDVHFDRLAGYLDECKILSGGNTDRNDLYIPPTFVEPASPDARIMQGEIFGPILPVIEYSDIDEACQFIRQRPRPLVVYCFSKNRNIQKKITANTYSGALVINDTMSYMISRTLPFGGTGNSGMGRYHGKFSFDTFSHYRGVFSNRHMISIFDKYPPYNVPLETIEKSLKYIT